MGWALEAGRRGRGWVGTEESGVSGNKEADLEHSEPGSEENPLPTITTTPTSEQGALPPAQPQTVSDRRPRPRGRVGADPED